MYNPFKTHQKWLIRGLLIFLVISAVGLWRYSLAQPEPALAAPVLQEPEPQHCCRPPHHTPTPKPTATYTPTPTPSRTLLACQVTGIIFSKDRYTVGEVINLTVRLADGQGTPLAGAQVVASVEKPAASVQATTGFGLIDRVGEYDGVYSSTDIAGTYRFTIMASDPTGLNFRPCTGETTVTVNAAPVTPGPTTPAPITPVPTTPAPTGTPALIVDPTTRTIAVNGQVTQTVAVRNISGLTAVRIEVAYNPAVAQVVDADPNTTGVQVEPVGLFAGSGAVVARNEVATATGRIFFDGALLAPNQINGNQALFEIDWSGVGAGTSQLLLENVLLLGADGQTPITATLQNGSVQVTGVGTTIAGTVKLQGRSNYSGVVISSDTGAKIKTNAAGAFTINSGNTLKAEFPGYLSAQADLQAIRQTQGASSQTASMGVIMLLAGDVNGDNLINILDLASIAKNYRSGDSLSDLNSDGSVDILDLALVASNYTETGPLTNWQ